MSNYEEHFKYLRDKFLSLEEDRVSSSVGWFINKYKRSIEDRLEALQWFTDRCHVRLQNRQEKLQFADALYEECKRLKIEECINEQKKTNLK